MVKVNYKDYELTVKGHAGYAEKGKDIVCASVSTLAITLVQNGILLGDNGILEDCDFNVNDGDVRILMRPKKGYENLINAVITTILNGFVILADSYPDYVSYSAE